MLSHWTGNRYKATRHRVLPYRGEGEGGRRGRISIPFFFEPNIDAVIKPLPLSFPSYSSSFSSPSLHLSSSSSSSFSFTDEEKERDKKKNKKEILFAEHLHSKVANNFNLYGG